MTSTPVQRWEEPTVGGNYTQAAIWTLLLLGQLSLKKILGVCEENDLGLILENVQAAMYRCILPCFDHWKRGREGDRKTNIANKLALTKLAIFFKSQLITYKRSQSMAES